MDQVSTEIWPYAANGSFRFSGVPCSVNKLSGWFATQWLSQMGRKRSVGSAVHLASLHSTNVPIPQTNIKYKPSTMKTKTLTALLAAIAISAPGVSAQRLDVIAQAKQSGVIITEPVTVSFEWTRPIEGKSSKEVAEELQRMKFVVTTSTTKGPEASKSEYRLSAKLTGLIQEAQLISTIERMNQLTVGEGSVNWKVSQVRR